MNCANSAAHAQGGTAAGAVASGAAGATASSAAAANNLNAPHNLARNLARSLRVYAITDRSWLNLAPHASEQDAQAALCRQVRAALDGGATFIQMREKHLNTACMIDEARALQEMCHAAHVPFVVNDNVEVARAAGASGVHVGQSDMCAKRAREALGARAIVGVSAQTVEQAVQAENDGANYVGVGAMFPTTSKDDAAEVSLETLRGICNAVSIPVVAIGGVTCENVSALAHAGIVGVAVIRAIFAQKNITAAASQLEHATRIFI